MLHHSKDSDKVSFSTDAGWSSLAARRAHNPKVAGSNPAPATTKQSNGSLQDLSHHK
uniref:Uncharacterized protein n=1 Tax=Ralstonia solanacearum TaxID=305 RepID=A0A0S4VGG7_RALSL|nr:protein of unknown function [Ralstonia solanacearum]CUV23470.1 protein of unknown function [Ralstonia solanacearum]CUV27579.1 protein of unknown function [Ralstonia solanacearum]CUV33627.1 protein of unknown function [Ralstonia solanacearum]CUV44677.1 protein of unknown function [Ralstonia solanacearum]